MTEQQLDAEVSRYEPMACKRCVVWVRRPNYFSPAMNALRHYVQSDVHDRLTGELFGDGYYRRYPTREAAFADLRQAIRLSGSAAAQ